MRDHPEPPRADAARALAWTPAEELEDGLEVRLLVARGRKVGLAFHADTGGCPRTVLVGPVADAIGEPDGWLDGLDAFEALDRIEAVLEEVTWEELQEALAGRAGPAYAP